MKKNMKIVKPYSVEVSECLVKYVHVLAESEVEAVEKVIQQYRSSEIILGAENYVSVDFSARQENSLDNVRCKRKK